jgi:peptidylprolyl isomerase
MSPGRSGRQKKFKHTPRKSNKLPLAIGLLIIIIVVITVVYVFATNNPSESDDSPTSAGTVLLQTSMGDITIQLRGDRPITTSNFKNLIQQGIYDGTIFHRVIADFMIQGGDPTGTGYGDSSIPSIQDELDGVNENNRGTIAMANTGEPNTGSSQFFINAVDNNYLDTLHSVFGTVISGMDVVDAISSVTTDANYKPLTDVMLIKAEIIS